MDLKSWKTYFVLKHMKHDIQLLEMINVEYVQLEKIDSTQIPLRFESELDINIFNNLLL